MKWYTGYYANWRNYSSDNFVTVAISRYLPNNVKVGAVCKSLAPSENLLSRYKNDKVTKTEYVLEYIDALCVLRDSGKLSKILEKIKKNFPEKDVVFLCYEKKGEFCHRQTLAIFLKNFYGLEVKEL